MSESDFGEVESLELEVDGWSFSSSLSSLEGVGVGEDRGDFKPIPLGGLGLGFLFRIGKYSHHSGKTSLFSHSSLQFICVGFSLKIGLGFLEYISV